MLTASGNSNENWTLDGDSLCPCCIVTYVVPWCRMMVGEGVLSVLSVCCMCVGSKTVNYHHVCLFLNICNYDCMNHCLETCKDRGVIVLPHTALPSSRLITGSFAMSTTKLSKLRFIHWILDANFPGCPSYHSHSVRACTPSCVRAVLGSVSQVLVPTHTHATHL